MSLIKQEVEKIKKLLESKDETNIKLALTIIFNSNDLFLQSFRDRKRKVLHRRLFCYYVDCISEYLIKTFDLWISTKHVKEWLLYLGYKSVDKTPEKCKYNLNYPELHININWGNSIENRLKNYKHLKRYYL